MKIAVLAGGFSPEHDVSMASGALVAEALAKRGHSVALCDVGLPVSDQPCAVYGGAGAFKNGSPIAPTAQNADTHGGRLIGDGVFELCEEADVVFTALHGGAGEDGHIQAALELLGVKFTGSDMASCHAAMDKYISKLICGAAGLDVPPSVIIKKGGGTPAVRFPAVIKPRSCGSSIGVSFVYSADALEKALADAFEYESDVIVEKKIDGREFSVSVLGDAALPSVEILPKSGVYDFSSKYVDGLTDEICPGRLSSSEEKEIGRLALTAHRALGLGDYSRSDFIYGDGKFYYLETNALPGLTENSLLPKAAMAVGLTYGELCEKICAMALERKKK